MVLPCLSLTVDGHMCWPQLPSANIMQWIFPLVPVCGPTVLFLWADHWVWNYYVIWQMYGFKRLGLLFAWYVFFPFFLLLTYLNLSCVSCTQLIVKSFLSNLINSAIFIWVFRPFIYNVIIDMARFTLAILLSFFPFVSCLYFSDPSLNDWVCYFTSFVDYFTSSIAPNEISHWLQPEAMVFTACPGPGRIATLQGGIACSGL